MDKYSILEYVTKVKDAEQNVYIWDNIYSEFAKNVKKLGPTAPPPTVSLIRYPDKPVKRTYAQSGTSNNETGNNSLQGVLWGVGFLIFGLFCLAKGSVVMGAIFSILSLIFVIIIVYTKSKNDELTQTNSIAIKEQYEKEYQRNLEQYEKKKETIDVENREREEKYRIAKAKYDETYAPLSINSAN